MADTKILVVSLCVYTDIKASEDINTLSINQSYLDMNVPVYRCIVAFAYICMSIFINRRNDIFQIVPQHSLPLKSLMLSFLLLLFN